MSGLFRNILLVKLMLSLLIVCLGLLVLVACQPKDQPVKVGFIGCLTGRSTDLGVAGRNGFILAVDEINRAGGLSGRQLVPVILDTASDTETAKMRAHRMVEENVEFVVGPITSQIAMSIVPILNKAKIPLISPTVSTNKLIGIDDYFFRVYYANSQAAEAMAAHLVEKRMTSITAFYDTRNLAYTGDWLRIFERNFSVNGRKVDAVPFNAVSMASFYDLVAAAALKNPDGILILANAIDTALICQQSAKLELTIPKFATGWSYSGKLISYGGRSVEGLTVVQSVDLNVDRKEVKNFLPAYRGRFYNDPMFPAVHAYDATRLALQALQSKGKKDLKQALLAVRNHPGILQDFSLDKFGDVVDPPIFFMQIDEALFHSL